VFTEIGPVEINLPRDRDGSSEPAIVRKRQRRLEGIDQIVLSLTARGLARGPHRDQERRRCRARPWSRSSHSAEGCHIDEPGFDKRGVSAPNPVGVYSIGYRKNTLMNITVFGANGLTIAGEGRRSGRARCRSGDSRHPEFPISHDKLTITEADVHDELAVMRVLESGSDAVLSTLGVPFDRKPIDIYSDGITKVTNAMTRHGIKRIVAVSSTAVAPHHHAEGGFLLNRIMQPLVSKTIGKVPTPTCASWKHPPRPTSPGPSSGQPACSTPSVSTNHRVSDGPLDGVFTSRADLAALLLAQATDTSHVGQAIEITTSEVPRPCCR
jgi:hypothetical protein